MLLSKGFKLLAFIPGDADKRGPIYEGLPTLESHRYMAPCAAFISLLSYDIDGVFIGDGIISQFQALKEQQGPLQLIIIVIKDIPVRFKLL